MRRSNIAIILAASALILTAVLIIGFCSKDKTSLNYEFNTDTKSPAVYPNVSFAVISDLHIYDPELGSTGETFEKVILSDRKLLLDSVDLLGLAIDNIIEKGVNIVLVSGDLTKDGEIINHQIAANRLTSLVNSGIKVFVIPGNHDYNNPHAEKYTGTQTEPVPAASGEDFVLIHGEFGYNAAISRDEDSLSYVAEPEKGLWILALDSTRCRENKPGKKAVSGGGFSQQTINWITSILRKAKEQDKAVIAMMHHGAMEHWKGQAKLHPNYIVSDFENFSNFLASWDVRVVFTGHYHANDITHKGLGDDTIDGAFFKFIYDIETGSLVTAPCPIRYITIKNNVMHLRTDFIIDRLKPGTDFAANAHSFVKKTVMLETAGVLKKYWVSKKDIAIITDAVGDAYAAHYNGDEKLANRKCIDTSKLSFWGRFILDKQQYILNGLWDDLYPQDNDVTFPLHLGKW